MKNKLILIGILAMIASTAKSQVDPHFSQFYANPLWLNPGLTGITGEGGYRVTALYRNQWNNVMSPFETMGVSADIPTNKNLNFGVSLLDQKAGDAGYRFTTGNLSIAYSGLRFGPENQQQVTIGIQGGFISRKFDPTKFQFGDQWNPITGYNPGASSADRLIYTASSVLDFGAGVSYLDGSADKKINFFGGLAAFHINQPKDPFLDKDTLASIPMRFSGHVGASVQASDNVIVRPNVLVLLQGNASEIMGGVSAELLATDDLSVLLGLNYRLDDAFSPFLGLNYHNFMLGASYDVNASTLGKAVKGTNSFEITLSIFGKKKDPKNRYLACPRI